MEVNTEILEMILGLKKITNISNLMSRKVKEYTLHEKGLIHTTRKEITMIASRLNRHHSKLKQPLNLEIERGSERWFWGEQKLFIWTVIYYAQALYIETSSIDSKQFSLILQLFPLKDLQFLRYEFVSTFGEENSIWSSQEIELLARIAEGRQYQNQWKKISYKMFIQSKGRHFKSRESCRNRWFNHINPLINKQEWTKEEDFKMISFILKKGTRWASIAKTICQGRNEHMIKNRYRSLVRKLKINEKASIQQTCQEILQFLSTDKAKNEENSHYKSLEIQAASPSQPKTENIQKRKGQSSTQQMNPQDPIDQSQSCLFEDPKIKDMLSIDQIFKVLKERNRDFQNQQYLESFDGWLERIIRNEQDYWTIQNYLC